MARFQTHKENIPPSSISFQLSNDYDEDEEEENLQERIEEYKRKNPEELEELTSFVDDVIKEAQIKVAEKQIEEGKTRNGNSNSFITGLKSRRVVTRARSLAVRFFDVISNCANSVPNPVQAVRLRRQQTTSAPSPRHMSFHN